LIPQTPTQCFLCFLYAFFHLNVSYIHL
jgi:hypothetical protein